ncbi:MAG: hypothetical protein WBA89_27785, partial [Microcoleus sp.]|uniref:hypothetical protein n=1 Tax=Microcoleus sp. TaxID=44472 RepID=UPI003C740975
AAVAKIFGGSLPEKIARCLGFIFYIINPLSDLQTAALFFDLIFSFSALETASFQTKSTPTKLSNKE